MAGEWMTATIGDVALRVTKGTTPTTVGGKFVDQGINFIKVESITDDGRIDTNKLAHIDGTSNALLSRSVLEEDDILFTIAGTIGRVALVPASILPANTNQAVAIVRPNPKAVVPRFLYYVLRDDSRVRQANTRVVQSVQANFSLGELSSLDIPLPPLSEQRAIAHILGTLDDELSAKGGERTGMRRVLNTLISKLVSGTWSVDQGQAWLSAARPVVEPLDDKIELNRRMSETLEQMAQALFKAWFVDFEPVRAKMEGRWQRGQSLPGLPAHLYDLFPDRLVDSELGEIPEGWEVGTIADLADIASGKRPEVCFAKPSEQACVPLWGGNGPMGFVPQPLIVEPILLTGRVGTLGSVFRITQPCWPSDNTLILRSKYEPAFEYLFFQLRRIDFDLLNRGSTQPLLTQTDLKSQELLIPSPKIMEIFSGFVKPFYTRIDQLDAASRTFAALRDALLPKLISGELRVKDAERFLEERAL